MTGLHDKASNGIGLEVLGWLRCNELQHYRWSKVNTITIREYKPVNALAAMTQPIEAFRVLDHPRAVFLVYPGMQARDAL